MPQVLGVQDGSMEVDSTLEKQGEFMIPKKEFKYTVYVLGDDLNTTEDDILATTGVPALWSTHNGCFCKARHGKVDTQVVHPTTGYLCELWLVTADFDSSLESTDPNPGDDPTSYPPTVEWSGENVDTVLDRDVVSNDPIETKNHEKILWSRPVVHSILKISRYENYPFDQATQFFYANNVNSAVFWGADIGHAYMHPMSVTQEIIEGIKYCKVDYTIEFAFLVDNDDALLADPFDFAPLHQGTLYRNVAAGPILKAKDKEGHPRMVNLDNNGVILADDAPPVYLLFKQFPRANFNDLNLGPF